MIRRMLHLQLFESTQFAKLTMAERLLYIGLIIIADDEGRFKASPKYLKIKVFPYDRTGAGKIKNMLNNIFKIELVVLYNIHEELFGYHPNWKMYQIIRKDRQKPSNIPCPELIKRQPSDGQMGAQDNINKNNINKENTGNHKKQLLEGLKDKNPELAKKIKDAD